MDERVYSPIDGETDVTPRVISDLALEEQIHFITQWFRALFEDPQNEMPYAEKGEPNNYYYPWGGPYDAEEEIREAFEGLASEEAIKTVAEAMLQEAPFEWAPTSNHPERRRLTTVATEEHYLDHTLLTLEDIQERLQEGVTPSFGDPLERQQRDTLRRNLAVLRELLAQDTSQHGRIGHNQPPEGLALTVKLKIEAIQVTDQMDSELAKDVPEVTVVAESAGRLKAILSWIGKKLDISVNSFMRVAGAAAAGITAELSGVPLFDTMIKALNAALEWMNTVTPPL